VHYSDFEIANDLGSQMTAIPTRRWPSSVKSWNLVFSCHTPKCQSVWMKSRPFRLAASVSWCWSWEKEGEQLKWSLACRLYRVRQ